MESVRPPRCRPVPPHVVAATVQPDPAVGDAGLLERLEVALAALPHAERTAVVAAHGYDEGAVGAAIELDLEIVDADAVTRNALELLRAALFDDER